MDVVQKILDLTKLALDERTPENERNQAALGALRILDRYKDDLFKTKKRIDVAADLLDRYTSPDYVEAIASRVERVTAGVERIFGSAKKVAGLRSSGGRTFVRRRRGS